MFDRMDLKVRLDTDNDIRRIVDRFGCNTVQGAQKPSMKVRSTGALRGYI